MKKKDPRGAKKIPEASIELSASIVADIVEFAQKSRLPTLRAYEKAVNAWYGQPSKDKASDELRSRYLRAALVAGGHENLVKDGRQLPLTFENRPDRSGLTDPYQIKIADIKTKAAEDAEKKWYPRDAQERAAARHRVDFFEERKIEEEANRYIEGLKKAAKMEPEAEKTDITPEGPPKRTIH